MQRELDFDRATLNSCVNRLQPKRLKTVFRGLLFAAAEQPYLVDDIDGDGYMILTVPVQTVASWAGVTDRAVQINVDRLRKSHPRLLEQSSSVNTASQWLFSLRSVLPKDAVDWFIALVENSRKFTPNFSAEVRGELPEVHPKVHPELLIRTSYCFLSLNTASLLAEKLKSFGIAARSGKDLASFHADDSALDRSEAVSAIADAITTNPIDRQQVFLAASIARDKERPWGFFRSALVKGYDLKPTKQQRAFAATLQRAASGLDAEVLMPRMTADQAWQKLRSTIARIDYLHASQDFQQALGPELHAAARSVGIGKIATSDPRFQTDLRNAFAAAWNDQSLATAIQ
jgi:hypothetical protein